MRIYAMLYDVCSNCSFPLEPLKTLCGSCRTAHDAPNVRLAKRSEEQKALDKAYAKAKQALPSDLKKVAILMERLVKKNTHVAIARPVADVQRFVSNPLSMMPNHRVLVSSGMQRAGIDEIDETRIQFENAALPNITDEIRFSALTICNSGCLHFGDTVLVLKPDTTADRTSFFMGNPLVLAKQLGVTLDRKFPAGLRSTWENVHKLCIIKHQNDLQVKMKNVSDFQKMFEPIVSGIVPDQDITDYIEGHIFGGFPPKNIEKIIYTGDTDEGLRPGSDWAEINKTVKRLYPHIECLVS